MAWAGSRLEAIGDAISVLVAGAAGVVPTDADVIAVANLCQNELVRRGFFFASEAVSVTAGDGEYDLSDLDDYYLAYRVEDADGVVVDRWAGVSERLPASYSGVYADRTWRMDGMVLVIDPEPAESGVWTVYYYSRPVAFDSSENTTPESPEGMDDWFVYKGAEMLLRRDWSRADGGRLAGWCAAMAEGVWAAFEGRRGHVEVRVAR